jgi:hypothetical protein
VGTSEGWVPHGCKVDGFMNTVMPQYNSQPLTRNMLARNRIAHYQRSGQNPQPPTTTKATDLATVALFIASPAYADPDPHMSNPLAGLFSRGGLPLERGERARPSRVW